jgi:DNA repair photolyase
VVQRIPPTGFKGRGALTNPGNRFDRAQTEQIDDGWFQEVVADSIRTEVRPDASKTVISRNSSPDIPFDQSINPYRGCEHGCVFCYARPTHAFLGLSPGMDFETKLAAKMDAAAQLKYELAKPGYRCAHIMLGANTDPYQPIERELKITRSILEVLAETRHPVAITTRSVLLLRDIDLLAEMAQQDLVQVVYSVTTFDADLKRKLEPRSASSTARLEAMRQLNAAGVPVAVLAAPMIPAINDSELEEILERSRKAGATQAGYVLLRLPLEVAELFRQWLEVHYPDRAAHVMSLVQATRDGRDNTAEFGARMRGSGVWAQLLGDRFRLAKRKLGFAAAAQKNLRTDLFRPPSAGGQMGLGF